MDESQVETEYSKSVIELESSSEIYILRLYVAFGTPHSTRAIYQTQKVCNQYLAGRHKLEIVDIHQYPERLEKDKIFATPTLVKESPPPQRKLVGNMPSINELIVHLNL